MQHDAERALEERLLFTRYATEPTPALRDAQGAETLADTVGGEEDGYDRAEQRATIDQLLRTITPREREVLRLRFEQDLTQAEIGEIIGVSQMQVSRLIRQALARLRLTAQSGQGGARSPR